MIANEAERKARNANILDLYLSGMGYKKIAKQVGLTPPTVRHIVESMGGTSMSRAFVPRGGWPAKEKKPELVKKPMATDKEPNQWPQSEVLRHFPYDRFFGLHWGRIKAERWANFVQELTRTPGEYSRNGGAFWSPTNEEIAARLKVPVETVDDWTENGIDEPWEIAVVNAYARVGIVVTIDEPLVSPEAVQNAVDRAPTFEDVVETTGIPMPILLRHMVHGAPSHTHGRAYLLMDSEEYRQRTAAITLHKENEDMKLQIPQLLADGLTYEEVALELGVSTSVVTYRVAKYGLTSSNVAKGGRVKVEAVKRPAWYKEGE